MQSAPAREDRLGRFAPTPLSAALWVMGRSLTLETNSETVLRQVRRAFTPYGAGSHGQPEFRWRIVSETRPTDLEAWPEAAALASESLRFVHFGRNCFFAADLVSREAVGAIPEFLAPDESTFCGMYLAAAFQCTAPALGLTQLSAACLALDRKGLLLLAPTRPAKSAVSRLAAKLGMEFNSEQATFIESNANGMAAWGWCWPPSPQPDALMPESAALDASRPVEGTFRSISAHSVTPVICIYLEPATSEVPRLSPIHSRASLQRLQEEGLAAAVDRQAGEAVARALSRLPAYRLAYGRDPAAAAVFLHNMLRTHNLLEAHS
ncbi:MAG: hypothetical protein ACE145_04645 [Terriglobia bacterium]